MAPLPSEPPAEPDDAEGETTVFRRDQNTVISRGQHDSCKIVTYEEARAEYSVLILAPPTEPGLSRVEWELCDFGGGDRSVRVLLVPDHVGDTRSLTTEDVIAEGGRYLMQSQAASRPEPHFLMIQQRRQPVRVRGEEASIFVAGLNSRRERFCMLEWAEPEIDGYRVYYFNAPPGACDDGRAVEWANALVELQP